MCDGLLGNSTISSLCLDNNRNITSTGCHALSAVIRDPNCNLKKISLNWTGLTDERSNILGAALSGSSVKVLHLSHNESISRRGWHTLLNHLARTSIISLNLRSNKIDNGGLAALANIGTLKTLILSRNESITPEGWRHSSTRYKELDSG